jgi:hypothetical protein
MGEKNVIIFFWYKYHTIVNFLIFELVKKKI